MKRISLLIITIALNSSLFGQQFGNAINLDGIDDYLVVPHHESLNPGDGNWSVVFWIKAADKDQVSPVVMKRLAESPYTQYSYGFGKDDPHNPEPGRIIRVNHIDDAGVKERSGYMTRNIADGTWHHVAVVADKNQDKIIIYADGAVADFVPLYYHGDWPNVTTTSDLIIAKGSGGDKVEGLLDELSIWNKAMNLEQIKLCMHDTLPPDYYKTTDSSLVAYYRFDNVEDFGKTGGGTDDIKDYSSFGNHADIEGSPGFVPSIFFESTIYVDQSNNTGVENGTKEHPYNTLAEGMDAAVAGQTLFIANGNYTVDGGFWYLKPGVKIEGQSKENTVLNAIIHDTTYSNLPVGIKNLSFNEYSLGRNLLINESIPGKSYITNCNCNDIFIAHGGGYVNDTAVGPIPYFEITNNEVQQSISFNHGPGKIVGKNVVAGNKANSIGLKHGFVQMTDDPLIYEVGYLIESNELIEGIGFSQGGSIGVEIEVKNNKAKEIGISSGAGYKYTIQKNTFQDGYFDSSGANWTTFSNNTIVDGRIEDSSGGIDDGKEDAIIENNIINFSNPNGDEPLIIGVSSASVTIKNNVITGNGEMAGMRLVSGTPTNILDNTITVNSSNNDLYAVIETKAGGGVINGNKIQGGYWGYFSKSGATQFSNNEITGSHHGFYSVGSEEVKNNSIKNCTGHGMILAGLKGPVHGNTVMDNDSAGIYVMTNVGLGGSSPQDLGRNIIKNNGWYDMVIAYDPGDADTLFAQNNVWDHETLDEILQHDILNLYPNKVKVDIDSFIIPPDPPILLNPTNAITGIDTSINLTWQSSSMADYYFIQVAKDIDFNSLVYNADSLTITSITLDSLEHNTSYYWRSKASNLAGESNWSETWQFTTKIPTGIDDFKNAPIEILVNYPNPFKEVTTITYSLIKPGFVFLKVYDMHGRDIVTLVDSKQTNGVYSVEFDGSQLLKGVYLCQMIVGESMATRKLIISD